MYIKDLLEIFARKNNIDEIRIIGLRPGEKIDETLVNYDERTHSVELEKYYVIKPCYKTPINPGSYIPYTSLDLVLSKDGLKEYLKNLSIV
jgi:FlaA1/EpsC-like NDP-sugar epimerase